ncbi:unnamed protein product [Ilex paraguariensis]|uniref:Uncharacterized protein n=1 Tax=Ilex paraguariensis TaxID=185542 RepID=A0ABC8U6U7_9AQUA
MEGCGNSLKSLSLIFPALWVIDKELLQLLNGELASQAVQVLLFCLCDESRESDLSFQLNNVQRTKPLYTNRYLEVYYRSPFRTSKLQSVFFVLIVHLGFGYIQHRRCFYLGRI